MTIVLFNTTYICLSFSHEPVSSRVLVGYFLSHKMNTLFLEIILVKFEVEFEALS